MVVADNMQTIAGRSVVAKRKIRQMKGLVMRNIGNIDAIIEVVSDREV